MFTRTLLLLGLGLTYACATAPADTAPAPVSLPLPELSEHTLDNGLRVLLIPDHSAPLVSLQIWVDAGSVDEYEIPPAALTDAPPHHGGITGLAHFFEHLLFQGTERFPDYDAALNPLGAKNNAFTYHDATVYWVYTPKEHLPFVLDLEADRFQNIKLDFLHVEPEREVVKSERRQRVDTKATERAEELAVSLSLDDSPYRWGPIGWMRDLNRITLEEVQAFWDAHYRADKTTLILAGDFSPVEALALIQETWGNLPGTQRDRSAQPPPSLPSPTPLTENRHDYLLRAVSSPVAYWSYAAPAPNADSLRDYLALELVDHALTAGKSSRLGQRLIYTDAPIAASLWARLMPLRGPYAYVWRADLLPGHSLKEFEDILHEELSDIATSGLRPEETQRAIAAIRTDAIRATLSNSDKALTLGFALRSTGNPLSFYERLAAYDTITPTEIQNATRRWLLDAHRAQVAVISPERLFEIGGLIYSLEPEADHVGVDPESGQPILGTLLQRAFLSFLKQHNLRHQEIDIQLESDAIAALEDRSLRAFQQATEPSAKAAITRYNREQSMGLHPRRERLTRSLKEYDNQRQALIAEQHEILDALNALRTQGLETSNITLAIQFLATPVSEAVPVPPLTLRGEPIYPRPGHLGASDIALRLIAAFSLDLRGQYREALGLRRWIMHVANPDDETLNPDARYATRASLQLAYESLKVGPQAQNAPPTEVQP